MKNLIYISIFLIFLSCEGNKSSGSLQTAFKYLNEYSSTHNIQFLKKAYNELIKNPYYKENGLNYKDRDVVLPILMYSRNYDELEALLTKNTSFSFNEKEISLNMVKSLKIYKKDKNLAKSYIDKNLLMIKELMIKNPKDSTMYGEYFLMKLYNSDRNSVLKQIDSMQKSNKNYSSDFYDNFLKDMIKHYPKEFLYN